MKIHEYQAKELLKNEGISVPVGMLATTVDQAVSAADSIGYPAAIKAQVHAGGRGKAGGIKVVSDSGSAREAAEKMLGMTLTTAQTGGEGKKVSTLLIEKGVDIESELYLSILPDRTSASITVIASRSGGMNIEEVAKKKPGAIVSVSVNPLIGIMPYHLRQIAFGLELREDLFKNFCILVHNLYRLVIENDLLLCEINPLVITKTNSLLALDAKIEIDSNALFRHKNLADLHDPLEDDPLEVEAKKYNLNYIRLNGNVGTMVNGAGLAMATMDIIKMAGASPANFLDVGGGANSEMIANGFRILLEDHKVEAILINIFGGILRCDILARGVVEAANKVGLSVPLVVRMEGTNVEEGRTILKESGLDLTTATDLNDAALCIAAVAGKK